MGNNTAIPVNTVFICDDNYIIRTCTAKQSHKPTYGNATSETLLIAEIINE